MHTAISPTFSTPIIAALRSLSTSTAAGSQYRCAPAAAMPPTTAAAVRSSLGTGPVLGIIGRYAQFQPPANCRCAILTS